MNSAKIVEAPSAVNTRRLSPNHHCEGVIGMATGSLPKTCAKHPHRKAMAKGLCSSCYNVRRRQTNPEALAKSRAYHSRYTANQYRTIPRIRFNQCSRMLLSRYGLTRDRFDAMLIAQIGRCAICDKQMKRPNVDHCHRTGAVRGLLCARCNHLVGHIESPQYRGALKYLGLDVASAA